MKLSIRDGLATLAVVALLIPYIGPEVPGRLRSARHPRVGHS